MATVGVKVELEGAKAFSEGMKNLQAQTKLFNTEIKNIQNSMSKSAFTKSIQEGEALRGKLSALEGQSEALANRIKEATEAYGENDTRVVNLKQKYEALQGQIELTKNAIAENGGAIGALSKELEEVGGKISSVGEKITGFGEKMTKSVTVPLAAVGTASVKVAGDFESSMSQVAATMGYTVDELHDSSSEASKTMSQLTEFAQEMGETTAFSASESAEALNYMALAGYDAETSMKMLPTVLNLASAGAIDLASASDMVTDAQSALGLSLDETSLLVDQMAKASSKSNTSVAQLGEALLTVGATAANMNGGTAELATSLGVLADNGIKGAEGGTHLRNMILSLQSAAKDGTVDFGDFSVQVYDAEGNFRALSDIMMEVSDGMEGMTQESKDAITSGIFNKTDLASVNAMLNTSKDRFEELNEAIEDSAGSAQAMADVQLDNFKGQVTLLKSALEGMGISIGKRLTPYISKLIEKINGLVSWFNNLSPKTQDAIVKFGLIAASIGPCITVFGKFTSGVGSMITSLGTLTGFVAANPVMAGVAVGVGVVVAEFIKCKTEADNLYHSIADLTEEQQAAKDAADAYNRSISDLTDNSKNAVSQIDAQYSSEKKLVDELKNITDENGKVKEGYEDRAAVITDALASAFGIEIDYQNGVITKYDEVLDKIDEVIQKKKAEALLSTNQQAYIEALNGQKDAYEALKDAQAAYTEACEGSKTAQENLTRAQEDFDNAVRNGVVNGFDPYTKALSEAGQEAQAYNDKVKNTKEALEAQEQAFYNNQATIKNYEALQEATITGTENLDTAITNMTNNLISEAPIDFLRQQANDAKNYYDELLRDFESGEVAISQSQLDAAKSNMEQAEAILEGAVANFSQQGIYAGEGWVEGFRGSIAQGESVARSLVDSTLAQIAKRQETGSPAKKFIEQGEYAGQGYVNGLTNKMGLIQTTMALFTTMLQTNTDQQNQITANGLMQSQQITSSQMNLILKGMQLKLQQITSNYRNSFTSMQDSTRDSMSNITTIVDGGMSRVNASVSGNLYSVGQQFRSLVNSSYGWGSDFVSNFNNGMISQMQTTLSTVQNLANQIKSYLHHSTPDKGPLKDDDEWGGDFVENIARGIEANRYLVRQATKGLASDMVIDTPLTSDEIYNAIRSGSSDATTKIILNDREITRALSGMGVVFNG